MILYMVNVLWDEFNVLLIKMPKMSRVTAWRCSFNVRELYEVIWFLVLRVLLFGFCVLLAHCSLSV